MPTAGRQLRVDMLEAGAHLPAAVLAARLLRQPGALQPLVAARREQGDAGGAAAGQLPLAGPGLAAGASSGPAGWVPDLGHAVWQDLNLLG
jgi:hypothetical protein